MIPEKFTKALIDSIDECPHIDCMNVKEHKLTKVEIDPTVVKTTCAKNHVHYMRVFGNSVYYSET